MQLYKYSYGDLIGEYVVVKEIDDVFTLIYSKTAKTFPRLRLIANIVHAYSAILHIDSTITSEEIKDEYIAFKLVMNRDIKRRADKGQSKLLEACDSVYAQYHTVEDDVVMEVAKHAV